MTINDEDLLNIAKGVTDTSDEEKKILEHAKINEHLTREIVATRERMTVRKEIRRELLQLCFRAAGMRDKDNHEQYAAVINRLYESGELSNKQEVVYKIINPQLDSNRAIKWENFTKTWDLNPAKQSEIIMKEKWHTAGGQYDELGGCFPTAFTNQEFE